MIATLSTTNYSYNTTNQLTSDGTNTLTYDNNGNLTHDGVTAYTWDRANRMLSAGGTSYAYDGMSNRISQMVGSIPTSYLLDLQPGLAVVLGDSEGNRYVHAPRGIHAQRDADNNWAWMIQDGLGSVRGVLDDNFEVLESRLYAPYGGVFGTSGHLQTGYGFTGEQYDASTDLLYLRARHYKPELGQFTALDQFEGMRQRPMSLNGYSWVEGNLVNWSDPSGNSICELPKRQATIQPNNALQSSVTFAFIRANDNCRTLEDVWADRENKTGSCIREGLSIGTIIDGGILTHNHFDGGTQSFSNSQRIFNTYDWVYIDGENYTDIIAVSDIILSEPQAGTILMDLPYNETRFGNTASLHSINLSQGTPISFVYYPGDNGDWYEIWGGYPPHHSLRVGQGTYWRVVPSHSGGIDHALEGTTQAGPGDSGGGYFDGNGFLIGVHAESRGMLPDWVSIPILGGLAHYFQANAQIFTSTYGN